MKRKKKVIVSFFTKFLLALMLVQFHFPNQIFCIESDGRTSIEIAPMGSCSTTLQESTTTQETTPLSQDCDQTHPDGSACKECTDIPLKQDISLSRSDSDQVTLKILSPSYFNLYAGEFKPHIPYPKNTAEHFLFETCAFVYHPHQILESTILLI